jgi:TPR repeat protein
VKDTHPKLTREVHQIFKQKTKIESKKYLNSTNCTTTITRAIMTDHKNVADFIDLTSPKLKALVAKLGHVKSMIILGDYYYFKVQFENALKCYISAAELGNSKAMVRAGHIYEMDGDYKKSVFMYNEARILGNTHAVYCLSLHYKNMGDALLEKHYLDEAIELGDVQAIGETAFDLEQKGDIDRAIELYEKASGLGDTYASGDLLRIFESRNDIKAILKLEPNGDTSVTSAQESIMRKITSAIRLYKDIKHYVEAPEWECTICMDTTTSRIKYSCECKYTRKLCLDCYEQIKKCPFCRSTTSIVFP